MASFFPGRMRLAGEGAAFDFDVGGIGEGTFSRGLLGWKPRYERSARRRKNGARTRVRSALKKSRESRFVSEGYNGELDARLQNQTVRLHRVLNDLTILSDRMTGVLRRLKIGRINALLGILIVVLIIVSSQFYSIGMELYIDGERIGYVLSEQDYIDAAHTVEDEAEYYLDRPYKIMAVPSFEFSFVKKNQALDTADIESVLFSLINEVQNMYVLSVDGEVVGAYKYRSDIDQILESHLNSFVLENATDVRVEFAKSVDIEYSLVDLSFNLSLDEFKKIINGYEDEDLYHVIRAGDTLDKISKQYGVTRESIAVINPGVSDANIVPGERLLVSTTTPFLPVQMVATESYSEVLPYEIEKRNSDKLYKNQTEVLSEGAEGEAKVSAEVTYLNGVEVSRQVNDRIVLREPSKQVVLIGTKALPPTVSTGTFIRPYNGVVTSGYGWRNWQGRYSEFHTGVDLAGPRGSTVVAADGGTVTFAGWMGNYGRCVIIRHSDTVETLYAHNDTLTVEKGQNVAQGEKIAEIGMTGRTTGPHVHFEVRINGHDVNPFEHLAD